jgi:hypothetical protein
MNLHEQWLDKLRAGTRQQNNDLLRDYYGKETEVYRTILADRIETFSGTAKEFGEKFGLQPYEVGAFIDGINTSLETPVELKDLEEETQLDIKIVWRNLYKNMLKARADWLYSLSEWDAYYTEEERREITREFRYSQQAHSVKVGRNDPCPCGSGKKYKNCCGLE